MAKPSNAREKVEEMNWTASLVHQRRAHDPLEEIPEPTLGALERLQSDIVNGYALNLKSGTTS
jgi:hypothetical protein